MSNYYRFMGKALGYPDCCIEAFIRDIGSISELRSKMGDFTGFIPCEEHAIKISREEITLESLINEEKRKELNISKFPHALYTQMTRLKKLYSEQL